MSEPPLLDRIIVEQIVLSFGELSRHDDIRKSEVSWDYLDPLVQALKSGRWDLIAATANYMIEDNLPDNDPRKLKEDAKLVAFHMANEMEVSKAELIEYLRECSPELYETLPQSKSGLRYWWKEVGIDPPQARGNVDPNFSKYIKETKENFENLDLES